MKNNKGKVEVLNSIKEIWSKLNKKFLIIAASILVLIVIVIIIIINLSNSTKPMVCTREKTHVDFVIKETLEIELESTKNKKNKKELYIKAMDLDKSITIGKKYEKFKEQYVDIFKDCGKSAYKYLNKEKYKITQEGLTTYIKVNVDSKGEGLILDNITITKTNGNGLHDLGFNISSQLESSKTAYKIEDKYTEQTLKLKLEGLGYTCK